MACRFLRTVWLKLCSQSDTLERHPAIWTLNQKMNPAQLSQRLAEIRHALLRLHKTLVDSERASYEKTIGPIQSQNQFLQLLIRNPWFAWLQPFSQLIVAMDETLEEKEPLTTEHVEALAKQTRLLLVVSETGEGVSQHYFDALQRDPDVVLAHAEVSRLVNPRGKSRSTPQEK
jgi:hypothetical protein